MGYHNKFASTKFLGLYYWYVKIAQNSYMEQGLKYITLYDQEHIAPLTICYSLQIIRDKSIGAPVYVTVINFLPTGLMQACAKPLTWWHSAISNHVGHNVMCINLVMKQHSRDIFLGSKIPDTNSHFF